MSGTLREKGKVIGTLRAKRMTTGGAFSQFKGTCAFVGRCGKAIGQDIASWLANPRMDAELGDAR